MGREKLTQKHKELRILYFFPFFDYRFLNPKEGRIWSPSLLKYCKRCLLQWMIVTNGDKLWWWIILSTTFRRTQRKQKCKGTCSQYEQKYWDVFIAFFRIVERVLPRLSLINPAVVLGAIKVVIKFMDFISSVDIVKHLTSKITQNLSNNIKIVFAWFK